LFYEDSPSEVTAIRESKNNIDKSACVVNRLLFDELPELLTPKDLMSYLPIGRDGIYAALRSQGIRNVRVGQKFIIPKGALREFLGGIVE
jgi:excisionase family DNA binding protein